MFASVNVICGAFATNVTTYEVSKAATAFVSSDGIGASVLKGCSILTIVPRGHLWIVRLSPAGNIVMSGSDLVDPIVSFSKGDFIEPDLESPAYTVLESADASIAAREAEGGTRHARWAKFLDGKGASLMSAVTPPGETVVVEPFLFDHFRQSQPFNDYAPVCNAATNTTANRGRCPCGCVATAAAQFFHHLKWPARVDNTFSYDNSFTDTNGVVSVFPLRFTGGLPFDWDAMIHSYANSYRQTVTNFYSNGGYGTRTETCYDLRGYMDEESRYRVARLVFWCGVMAQMAYKSGGSSSSYGTIGQNVSDWFTVGSLVLVDDSFDVSPVLAALRHGIPCHVSIGKYDSAGKRSGHAIVMDGWADDGSAKYAHLNFGWGGNSDGYYNMDGDFGSYTEKKIYVGHYPRAKPQMDPLPAVCGPSMTVSWHFPDVYTNKLSGFAVAMRKPATTTSTFVDNFSDSNGVASGDSVSVGTDDYGYDGNLLRISTRPVGMSYTFSDCFTLTSASVLRFKFLSHYMLGAACDVQVRFDGGNWETIYTPSVTERGHSGWSTERVFLGMKGGKTCQLRISCRKTGSSYYSNGRMLVDDIELTDVLDMDAPIVHTAAATARTCTFAGLDAGSVCQFTVTPIISSALVEGEPSEAVFTSVAGERLVARGTPEIRSVSSVSEGFYRECGTNATVFSVVCSNTVVSLEALPSHLALVGDDDVTVTRTGNGTFKVSVNPSGINETNYRSRMILTLVATDASGTKCYKDLSLRFAPSEATVSEVSVTAMTSDGKSYSVAIPYSWLEECGLVAAGSVAAEYEEALASVADADGDGLPNWAEFVCGTSPTDPSAKLTVSIAMENGRPVVTHSLDEGRMARGFKAIIKGTDDLSTAFSDWTVVTETRTSTYRFFRAEIVPDK